MNEVERLPEWATLEKLGTYVEKRGDQIFANLARKPTIDEFLLLITNGWNRVDSKRLVLVN